MTNRINSDEWLLEQDIPPMGGQPDMAAGGPPMTQPGMPADPMGTGSEIEDPMATDPNQMTMNPPAGEDVTEDPQTPEMPEEDTKDEFESWKIDFVKESIKGNPNTLIDLLNDVRDQDLEPNQRKFVEDNLQINFLRQNANIFEASQSIRRLLKRDLDRTNPATSVINHIVATLEENPLLNEVYIKLSGSISSKMDLHRKFIASLIGAVQVGSGANNEDLIFEESDYSIRLSTRFCSKWGDVNIGKWYLKKDDPDRFLKDAELERLQNGGPEEKDVLRRRIVLESIAEMFKERAFVINVVGPEGTIQHVGWDLGNSLKGAYLDGKLVVRTKNSDNNEAFIDEEGTIIPIPDMNIFFVKEGDGVGPDGKPDIEEIEFIKHRDGMLYLSAQLDLIKESSNAMQGFTIKETPWQGNPSDMFKINRCVPSAPEMLLRQC